MIRCAFIQQVAKRACGTGRASELVAQFGFCPRWLAVRVIPRHEERQSVLLIHGKATTENSRSIEGGRVPAAARNGGRHPLQIGGSTLGNRLHGCKVWFAPGCDSPTLRIATSEAGRAKVPRLCYAWARTFALRACRKTSTRTSGGPGSARHIDRRPVRPKLNPPVLSELDVPPPSMLLDEGQKLAIG